MKITSLKSSLLALFTATVILGSMASAKADDHRYGPGHPYTYGHNGYWDERHRHHDWEYYHGHQGYWYNQPNGVRIFINL